MSIPKIQGDRKRMLPPPPVTVSEEDDCEEDDWQEDEDDFWRNPLSFLSCGGSPEPKKQRDQRLVTNLTDQVDMGGELVIDQSSSSFYNQEEDPFEDAPWLATTPLSLLTGLIGAEHDGPPEEVMIAIMVR